MYKQTPPPPYPQQSQQKLIKGKIQIKVEWFIQQEKGTNQLYSKYMNIHDDCSAAGENLDLISPLKYDNRQFLKQNGKIRKLRKNKEN